jgi:hypothetical protein
MATVGGPLDDFQDRSDRGSLNLNFFMGIKLVAQMRCESADFIGARSVSAATRPHIKLQPILSNQMLETLAQMGTFI